MKNEVKSKQLGLLLLLLIPGGKYLSMPSIFVAQAGRDSWVAIAVLFVFDFVCFMFLLWAINLNQAQASFYQILCKTITKVGAKIVLFVFFVFFVARLVVLGSAIYDLFTLTFSIKMIWLVFIILVGCFTMFFVARGFKAIARLNELLAGLMLLALLFIVLTPASDIQQQNLLPMFEDGLSPMIKTVLSGNFWFCDYIFIFFVMDKVKDKPKLFVNNTLCFAIGAALTIFMNVMFISLYGEMAEHTHLAISRISQYSLSSSVKGRLDWLSMSVWSMSIFIKLAVFSFSAYRCLEHIFEVRSGGFNFLLGAAVVVFYLIPLYMPVDEMTSFITRYFSIPFAVIQYAIPLLMPLMVKITQNRLKTMSNQLKLERRNN